MHSGRRPVGGAVSFCIGDFDAGDKIIAGAYKFASRSEAATGVPAADYFGDAWSVA